MLTKEDYLKFSKERLAELLVEAQEELKVYRDKEKNTYVPWWPDTTPYVPTYPWITYTEHPNGINICKNTGGPCTNKFHDCVNCQGFVTTNTFSTNIESQNEG